MKKRFRKILSVMMAIVMLSVCFVVPVSAETNEGGEIVPAKICWYCNNFSTAVCGREYAHIATGTHLFNSSCSVEYYQSSGTEMCLYCGSRLEYLGWHDCLQIHTCSWGRYECCALEYYP